MHVTERNGAIVTVDLSQDGAGLPCFPDATSEYDLFVTPNGKDFVASFPSANPADADPGIDMTLAGMTSLTMTADVTITNIWRDGTQQRGTSKMTFGDTGSRRHAGRALVRRRVRACWLMRGALCALLAASSPAFAQEAVDQAAVFAKPTGFFLVQPAVGSDGKPVPYGAMQANANWAIAQWGIPGPMAPALTQTTTYHSQNANIDVHVTERNGAIVTVDLSQDGAGLPCFPDPTSEYDLFVTPNGKDFVASFPSANPADADPGIDMTLAGMTSLTMTADVTITNIWRDVSPACAVNQRTMDFSAVFNNDGSAARPSQTLFYDLAPYFTRCVASDSDATCNAEYQTPVKYFYFDGTGTNASRDANGQITHQTFGYADDFHGTYGQPFMVPSQGQSYTINILPPVEDVIAKGPNGMDHDLSHWRLVGIYYGSQIWGNVGISSDWKNFNVTVK